MEIFENLIKKLIVVLSAFFLPIYTSVLIVLLIVACDVFLKYLAAKKTNEQYDESKSLSFFNKISVYLIAIIVTHSFALYFGMDGDLVIKTLVSFIVVKELTSADRHIEVILGFSLFKFLINKLNKMTTSGRKSK
jgi:hypothetical protein